jgi:putative addiction module killer protein
MHVRLTEVYRDWINSLKDRAGRARIQVRVDRLAHGNPGQHRKLKGGISELKIDVGPGYRVYYTERESELIVLLAGGDKSTQKKDIERAIELARTLALETTEDDEEAHNEDSKSEDESEDGDQDGSV